jgi:hypothetical protein
MSEFVIDFFELAFLTEACIPPTPIARHCLWMDVCDKHYHNMTVEERARLYDWIQRSAEHRSDRTLKDENYLYFLARYNPDNQYVLETTFKDVDENIETFLFEGKYHTKKNQWVSEEYINKINKV